MQSVSKAIMQWCVFVLGILSISGALVAFHFLAYYSERTIKEGEGFGIFAGIAVGAVLYIVAICNNSTIVKICEPMTFVLALLTFLGNIASPMISSYVLDKSPVGASNGVTAVTILIGLVSLVFVIICTIGFSELAEGGSPSQSSGEPDKQIGSEENTEDVSKTNFPE